MLLLQHWCGSDVKQLHKIKRQTTLWLVDKQLAAAAATSAAAAAAAVVAVVAVVAGCWWVTRG